MRYRYETHLHTCQGSACGVSTGAEQARAYYEDGFDGIFITDHFFGGNCAIDRHLPWQQSIDLFIKGYEDAYREGQKLGLKVFFGWEQGYQNDEYLIYGLSPDWLYAHPEIRDASRAEQFSLVHAGGGCVIQAHPFRDRSYIDYIRLALPYCDGIEAINAGNDAINDAYALRYAKANRLVMTAGSDNHFAARSFDPAHRNIACIALDTPLTDGADYARRILDREPIHLCYDAQSRPVHPADERRLVSYWVSDDGTLTPTGRDWYTEIEL